jgi:phosphinothricin acetyltransferase
MTTDGVIVRAGVEADLPALTEIYNHYVVTSAISFDTKPFTVEARRSWLAHYQRTGRHRLFVGVDDTSSILGYATSSPFRPKAAYNPSVETTVYCRPTATGRGVGSLLYGHLLKALADEDVHRAYAGVTLPNDASVRLHQKLGFTEIGVFHEVGRKHDRYWDVLWFERPVSQAS